MGADNHVTLLASMIISCYRFGMKDFSDNMRGAAMMTGSMIAFVANDAFMKSLAGDVPLFQALFLRGIGTVICLTILAYALGQLVFHHSRKDWALMILRALAEVAGSVFFLQALFHMPLANVSAVLQALPLTVALGAAVFLGEPLGWRRLLAILVGFAGVFLIIRPDSDGFNIYSIYMLCAVACVTLRDLSVRRMSAKVPSVFVGLIAAFAVMLLGAGVTATQSWVPVNATSAMQIGGAMVFIVFGYVFSVAAMRNGDISFVAPFRYTSLLAALVIGWAVFGDWPTPLTCVGAGIVVATGLFTLYRERRFAQQRRLSPRLR